MDAHSFVARNFAHLYVVGGRQHSVDAAVKVYININEEKIVPEREIKVFYSWQSDLPNSTTRGLIQNSIEAAVRNMRDTVEVTADRDTQGVYGSPDIAETIFSKIDNCDIFVADVSAVTTYHVMDSEGQPTDRIKATPNPNVLVELGYAVRVLGWENVICIMNDDYSNGGELPFDIEHHRLTTYSLNQHDKSEVRRQLRDIISRTILNVLDSGRRIPPQFSNILIGSWKPLEKNVSDNLIPYNLGKSKQVQSYIDNLLKKAKELIDAIQSIELPASEPIQDQQKKAEEAEDAKMPKIIEKELAQIPSFNQLGINTWKPVRLSEKEKTFLRNNIKKYYGSEVGDEFFSFGNLKQKLSVLPNMPTQYSGTDDEQRKYNNYVELGGVFADIKFVEDFIKIFSGLLLVPLAAKNVSHVSDEDIHISIQVDESTADIVPASADRLCDKLSGFEGLIYEKKFVESFFAQYDTADIKNERDDRFWGIEDTQSQIAAQNRVGFWGSPEYTRNDYKKQLSRYVATPLETESTSCLFHISVLHAGEAKWLSHLIILKPKADVIKMSYTIRSSKSNGELNGELKIDVSDIQ